MRASRGVGLRGDAANAIAHRRRHFKKIAVDADRASNENPAKTLGKQLKRLLDSTAALQQTRAVSQRVANAFAHAGVNDVEQNLVVGKSKDLLKHHRIDSTGRRCEQPIEQRKPVAHGAVGQTRDRQQHILGDLDALTLGNGTEMFGDLLGGNIAEIKALAARLNRLRNLVRFGGAENELHMRRRFLHGLEQRVERWRREHVNFVDDVDAVLAARRRKASASDKVARVVDASVGSAVDFDDIEVFAAENRVADGFGFRERAVAVECSGKDARHRGLANAAGAAKEIGVRGAVGLDRVLQRAGDRLLANDLAEIARSVAAGEHGVRLRGRVSLGRCGRGGCRALLRHRSLPPFAAASLLRRCQHPLHAGQRSRPTALAAKPTLQHEGNSGAAEDGQATVGSDRNAYGCCDQALTRFAADPPAGPGRLLRLQRGE